MLKLRSISSKLYFLILIQFYLVNYSNSQNFEWIKGYGAAYTDQPGGICAESNGNSVFLHNYQGKAFGDTLRFDSIISNDYQRIQNYLVKLDSNGKALRVVAIGNDGMMRLKGDGAGNYYVCGTTNGNDSVIKFDNNFNRLWSIKLSKTGLLKGGLPSFSNGHLYFIGITSDSNRIVELSPSSGNVIWAKNLCRNKSNSFLSINTVVHLKGKLYMSGRVTGLEGFQLGADTLYPFSGFVLQTDTIGNYIKRFLLQCKADVYAGGVFNMATDGNFLYICGNYKDTVYWGNKKFIPEYPKSSDHTELFAASLTPNLIPRWFFRPKVLDKTDIGKDFNYLSSIAVSKGLLYFSGQYVSKILIDSNILTSPTNLFSIIIFKADSLGNILWATNSGQGGGRTYYLDAKLGQSVYAAGVYTDSIKLGSRSKYSYSKQFDVFITKITDYSITRGRVISGPYCAGDTIKIPYTKFGIFDTANVFIAQLSDENGDFDKHFELGRLKSNRDSTIIGKLPLFKVVSSGKYRIRIISTKPAIQSYYRTDTLRLLIYSRDKADPGPPETICKGDTLKLNTYGGTKWVWNPKYNINNISYRQPLVWPMKDTLYRIAIADSSGCGKPDTAFKKVIVRPFPKSKLQFNDTIVCENKLLKIPAVFSGGDSVYQWEWFFVNPDKSFFSMKKGNLKLTDTLSYTSSVDQKNSEKLAIVLKDGCTSKADTSFINISQRTPVNIGLKHGDTSLCSGQSLVYKALASGGVSKYYKYEWKYLISSIVLSNKDSLKISSPKTEKVQLIVNDGCETLADTVNFDIVVKPPLKVSSNLGDTMLCFGKYVNYKATANGGDSTAYNFTWLVNDSLVSKASTFLLKTEDLFFANGEVKYLRLITKDNCTLPNDTIMAKLTILPAPISTFKYDLACSRTATLFQFTGTKPQAPITTTFNWSFNNEGNSNLENPTKLFNSSGTKKVVLVVSSSNGCNDTLKEDLFIKPQSKAEFTANDVCESDSVVFHNLSLDASSYNWKFGDGNTSKNKSPRHLYSINQQSITFNVTLVAIVANGCSDSVTKAVTINANPVSDFTFTKTGNKLDLKATQTSNSKYQWKFGSSDSVSTTTPNYTHVIIKPEHNKVCLKVSNVAGCESQTCKDVTLSIIDIENRQEVHLYPNPNVGDFTLNVPRIGGAYYMEIINDIGKVIYKNEFNQANQTWFLNLDSGVYLLKLTIGENTFIRRMIVNK